jgi:F0F1-type ATP synthase assembly protein I
LTGSEGGRYTLPALMGGKPDPENLWAGMSTGFAISVYLLSALLVWGGIGYLIDRMAGTGKVFTAIGMIVGAVAGPYLIYLRYGRGNDEKH